MNREHLLILKENILSFLENENLDYFWDEEKYNKILEDFNLLQKNFINLYTEIHKKRNKKLEDLRDKLKSNITWNFLRELIEKDTELKKYFNKKYSIDKISSQLKNICSKEANELNTIDLRNYGFCQDCKKSIEELKNIINFDEEKIKEEFENKIIKIMESEKDQAVFGKKLLEKYNDIEEVTNKVKKLSDFYDKLKKEEKTDFLEILKKLLGEMKIKVINIETIINSLKDRKIQFHSVVEFLDSFEDEFNKYKKENSDKNIEWILKIE